MLTLNFFNFSKHSFAKANGDSERTVQMIVVHAVMIDKTSVYTSYLIRVVKQHEMRHGPLYRVELQACAVS